MTAIRPPAGAAGSRRAGRLDQLTKPPGSLGRLEELARRLAEITGSCPPPLERPVIFTLAGDHGVVAEGVSAYPQVVTAQMVENFLRGGAAVNVLARHAGARGVVADLGVAAPLAAPSGAPGREDRARHAQHDPRARDDAETRRWRRSRRASRSSRPSARDGLDLVGTGEMGIGNTTAASADGGRAHRAPPVEDVTGPGTGVDDGGSPAQGRGDRAGARGESARSRRRARRARQGRRLRDRRARRRHPGRRGLAHPRRASTASSPARRRSRRCASSRTRAALPRSPRTARRSRATRHVLEALGLEPYLDLGMRLGEGTGAALCIGLARAAVAVLTEMATFKSAGVSGERASGGRAVTGRVVAGGLAPRPRAIAASLLSPAPRVARSPSPTRPAARVALPAPPAPHRLARAERDRDPLRDRRPGRPRRRHRLLRLPARGPAEAAASAACSPRASRRIVALKPDLVVATTAGNREETFEQLERLGIPVYARQSDPLSDVLDLIARLGALTGRDAEAARALGGAARAHQGGARSASRRCRARACSTCSGRTRSSCPRAGRSSPS